MAKFKVTDILEATGGKLVQGNMETNFSGVSTDSRTLKEGELFVALNGPHFDGHDFIAEAFSKGAPGAVVVREVSFRDNPDFAIIRVEDTLVSLRNIASFYRRRFNLPTIGITGSNGKTTTKEMTYEVLSSRFRVLKTPFNYNNQIGVSLALLDLDPSYDLAVLELGINHLGEMELLRELVEPDIAVFTNIGRTHLEFLDSPEIVFKEKFELVKKFSAKDKVIINIDDELLRKNFLSLKRDFSIFSFGIEQKADFQAEVLKNDNSGLDFRVKGVNFFLPVLGNHNIYNALASITVGSLLGISLSEMSLVLRNFHLPLMRMQVKRFDDFVLLDDAYNANPDSMRWAIETLIDFKTFGRRILVLGDMLELGKYSRRYHREIGDLLLQSKIDILLTVGRYAREINERAIIFKNNIEEAMHFETNREAVIFLKDVIKSGDVVLVKGSRAMQMEEISEGLRQYRRDTVTLIK